MKKISEAAVGVLGSMEVKGNLAVITAGQLDRPLYNEVAKALLAIGGTWVSKLKAHRFDGDPRDAIDQLVLSGGFVDVKQEFGFFATPAEVADKLVTAAELADDMSVLEPSAGDGSLIAAAMRTRKNLKFLAFELLPENVAKLRQRFPKIDVVHTDFLKQPARGTIDRVLMNPPFARQADVEHVLHGFRQLRPGGRLLSVMSGGVTFRDNEKGKAFRTWVKAHGGSIEPLPEQSFSASGTNVRTVILQVEKRR